MFEELRLWLEYIDLYTVNDYILVGTAVFVGIMFLLATNEFMEWKYFKYY
jgi:hypothetical protein